TCRKQLKHLADSRTAHYFHTYTQRISQRPAAIQFTLSSNMADKNEAPAKKTTTSSRPASPTKPATSTSNPASTALPPSSLATPKQSKNLALSTTPKTPETPTVVPAPNPAYDPALTTTTSLPIIPAPSTAPDTASYPTPSTDPTPVVPIPAVGADPAGWSSKVDSLHTKEFWTKGSWSWLDLLQKSFGVDQSRPLLINAKYALMYVVTGKLLKRDAKNQIISGTAGTEDQFFLFNATTCEVRKITAPAGQDQIWKCLSDAGKGITTQEIFPATTKAELQSGGGAKN
ncbi:hypothetical protein B0O99DRAFT_710741, partial [Bisporella sp. PMI_857]